MQHAPKSTVEQSPADWGEPGEETVKGSFQSEYGANDASHSTSWTNYVLRMQKE